MLLAAAHVDYSDSLRVVYRAGREFMINLKETMR